MPDNEIDRAIEQTYMFNYTKWLDLLEMAKYEHPESYAAMAQTVRKYRDWVAELSGRENLPEVPTA